MKGWEKKGGKHTIGALSAVLCAMVETRISYLSIRDPVLDVAASCKLKAFTPRVTASDTGPQ